MNSHEMFVYLMFLVVYGVWGSNAIEEELPCQPRFTPVKTGDHFEPMFLGLYRCSGYTPGMGKNKVCVPTDNGVQQLTKDLRLVLSTDKFTQRVFINHTNCAMRCVLCGENSGNVRRRAPRSCISSDDVPCDIGHIWNKDKCSCVPDCLKQATVGPKVIQQSQEDRPVSGISIQTFVITLVAEFVAITLLGLALLVTCKKQNGDDRNARKNETGVLTKSVRFVSKQLSNETSVPRRDRTGPGSVSLLEDAFDG